MQFTIGNFINRTDETDEAFIDSTEAFARMVNRAAETKHLLVGLFENENKYARYVAIDGEIFRGL